MHDEEEPPNDVNNGIRTEQFVRQTKKKPDYFGPKKFPPMTVPLGRRGIL